MIKIFKDFLSCKHYSKLSSRCKDVQLSTLERMQFTFHHALCFTCRRFSKQLAVIHGALTEIFIKEKGDVHLSEEVKTKIKKSIELPQDE